MFPWLRFHKGTGTLTLTIQSSDLYWLSRT
jgi:hypothetical protein